MNAQVILEKIARLVFGEQSEGKTEETQETVNEVTNSGESTESTEGTSNNSQTEQTEQTESTETVETTETSQENLSDQSLEAQVASLRKQLEVLSDFASIVSQVNYLKQFAAEQLTRNQAFSDQEQSIKEAFRELLPLVQKLSEQPTSNEVEKPKTSLRVELSEAKETRAANFLSSLRNARGSK
jgi:hypothetical protein